RDDSRRRGRAAQPARRRGARRAAQPRSASAGGVSHLDRRAVLMRRAAQIGKRMARLVLRVALWATAAALLLALALGVAVRTTPGRRALLRVALPLINARMAGHLSVRGLDGDAWGPVALPEARRDDPEGTEAICARRSAAA